MSICDSGGLTLGEYYRNNVITPHPGSALTNKFCPHSDGQTSDHDVVQIERVIMEKNVFSMKSIWPLSLLVLMLVFSACGDDETEDGSSSNNPVSTNDNGNASNTISDVESGLPDGYRDRPEGPSIDVVSIVPQSLTRRDIETGNDSVVFTWELTELEGEPKTLRLFLSSTEEGIFTLFDGPITATPLGEGTYAIVLDIPFFDFEEVPEGQFSVGFRVYDEAGESLTPTTLDGVNTISITN